MKYYSLSHVIVFLSKSILDETSIATAVFRNFLLHDIFLNLFIFTVFCVLNNKPKGSSPGLCYCWLKAYHLEGGHFSQLCSNHFGKFNLVQQFCYLPLEFRPVKSTLGI